MSRGVIIVGASQVAEVMAEQLTDHGHNVRGFVVDRAYLTAPEFCGLPVVAFENVEERFSVAANEFLIGLSFRGLNKLRQDKFEAMRAKGYRPFTFVHRLANVSRSALIGEGSFVMDFNGVQTRAVIGVNCMLWSHNHAAGHHSRLGSHCWLSSKICVSGDCEIGERSFLGSGATVIDGVKIGARALIGAGETVRRDLPDEAVYAGGELRKQKSTEFRTGVFAGA